MASQRICRLLATNSLRWVKLLREVRRNSWRLELVLKLSLSIIRFVLLFGVACILLHSLVLPYSTSTSLFYFYIRLSALCGDICTKPLCTTIADHRTQLFLQLSHRRYFIDNTILLRLWHFFNFPQQHY